MAGKKNTPAQVEEVVETITPAQEEPTVQEEPKAEPVKVYEFKAKNPYLTVADLGIQFRQGKAHTTNLAIARALAKVAGVELVEE